MNMNNQYQMNNSMQNPFNMNGNGQNQSNMNIQGQGQLSYGANSMYMPNINMNTQDQYNMGNSMTNQQNYNLNLGLGMVMGGQSNGFGANLGMGMNNQSKYWYLTKLGNIDSQIPNGNLNTQVSYSQPSNNAINKTTPFDF